MIWCRRTCRRISPRPFTLATDDPAISNTLATALYRPSADSLALGSSPGTLSFEYRDASGLSARKTFHFQPEGKPYNLTVDAEVDVGGAAHPVTLAWGPALGLGFKPDGSREVPVRALQYRDGKVERLAPSSLEKEPHYEGALRYAGVEEQYFLSVALPGTQNVQVDYQPVTLPVPERSEEPHAQLHPVQRASAGRRERAVLHGARRTSTCCTPSTSQLVRAIDFGMFAWLVVPLLQALKWINGFLGNYGWSIIVLTLLINIAIFPLRHRSMVSMKKMQAVQPEVKAIQDRYAKYKVTDPERQKMNQEMMALYKQKGVNPASGCVPMLLTLPDPAGVLQPAVGRRSSCAARRSCGGSTTSRCATPLHHARPHGRDDVLAAEDDAVDGRSGAAEDVSRAADLLHVHVPVDAERPRALLAHRATCWRSASST